MTVADTVCLRRPGDDLCQYVDDTTDNEWLAQASNWLIAKPFAILLLIVIGVVVRWIMHRLIDRLTRRAAAGRCAR